jgi:acyl-CoA synthetase (AMP-forming)/AMP-acid ligase II
MPPPLFRRLLEAFPGVDVQQVYGLTEAFGGVTALSGADHRAGGELNRSVGRALPGVVVTIRDASGAALPSGEDGEICVSSGSASTRYWGDSVDLPEPEYVRTGDVGRKDPLGYLFLVDRIKDMIKSGGENVYSIEVEAALAEHPEVDSVAVVGVPDGRWGERVHAEVVPRAGSTLTPADVITFARERLSAFKTPKSVTIRNAPLPVSAIGKVLKRQLRAEAESAPTASASSPKRPNC